MRHGRMWAPLASTPMFIATEAERCRERDVAERARDEAATKEIEDRLLLAVYDDGWRPKGWTGE